ncbi:MAG: glycosyltransferase family 2 protein [Moraxellaceae bacterium]|nr:MAG: glycosyltransferase family 2 protein [Moraxellaceae bacterium]
MKAEIRSIGIVIPAHNEQDHLLACLTALEHAIAAIKHLPVIVRVLVVLDRCTDDSLAITQHFYTDYLQRAQVQVDVQWKYVECDYQCVGQARALGVQQVIDLGASWVACSDADSRVHSDWLLQQLNQQPADAICGVVEVDSWQHLSLETQQRYVQHYQDRHNHQHIHGANLSFSAAAYHLAGGFLPLNCHEDVSLIEQMREQGLNIVWSNQVRVTTSSRLLARAPEGFAAFLNHLEHTLAAP